MYIIALLFYSNTTICLCEGRLALEQPTRSEHGGNGVGAVVWEQRCRGNGVGATVWGQRGGQRCGGNGVGATVWATVWGHRFGGQWCRDNGTGASVRGQRCGGNGVGETVKNRMLCLIAKHYSVPAFYYKLVYYKFLYFQAFKKFVFVTFKLLKIEKMAPLTK